MSSELTAEPKESETTVSDITKLQITALQEEYKQLTASIIALVNTNDRLVSISILILGIGFSVGIKDSNKYVIAFIPVGLALVLLYAASLWLNVHFLAGYKQQIENELNDILCVTIFRWEKISETFIVTNIAMRILIFPITILYVASCIYAVSQFGMCAPYTRLYAASLAILSIGLVWSYISIYRARSVGAQHAKFLLSNIK